MKMIYLGWFFLLGVCCWVRGAEPAARPVLDKGDVERFIKTFPQLKQELQKLGLKYDTQQGNLSMPSAMLASQEYLAILKKHGWDETFQQKIAAILLSYSSIEYKKQAKNVDPEMDKALREIESNPNLSPELKQQMKASIQSAKTSLKQTGTGLTQSVNDQDVELVRPLVPELKAVLEESRDKERRKKNTE